MKPGDKKAIMALVGFTFVVCSLVDVINGNPIDSPTNIVCGIVAGFLYYGFLAD